MLPRQKKPTKARRPAIVPTDLPVFDALQDAGLVVVMSEKGQKSAPPKVRKQAPRRSK